MKYIDQTGRSIELNEVKRVVSLVPSQTELLVDLDVRHKLVGVTKFCIHPKDLIGEIGHVGGTKNLNIDKIRSLKPDLIIGNKEENTKEEIEELQKEFAVWMSDILTIDDALSMIDSCGKMLNAEIKSKQLIASIQSKRQAYLSAVEKQFSCLYFIWKNPDMIVGSTSFIHTMIKEFGCENKGEQKGDRYPILDKETDLKPDFIFLSTEPFPFKQKDFKHFEEKFPDSKVLLVDGEMFSWYGSRLLRSYDYFQELRSDLMEFKG